MARKPDRAKDAIKREIVRLFQRLKGKKVFGGSRFVSWSAFSRSSDWPHANLEIMVARRMRFCP